MSPKKRKKNRRPGCIDALLLLLVITQVIFIAIRITFPAMHKIPWWEVFIPSYPIAAIFLIFFVAFGIFGYTMSKHG